MPSDAEQVLDPVREAPTRDAVMCPACHGDRGRGDVNAAADAAMYQRIGQLTRVLHDALRELGYDRRLEAVARGLPDAQHRLAYIATLTGGAAERVLGAVEAGQALQESTSARADVMTAECTRVAPAAGLGDAGAAAAAFVADVQAFASAVRASCDQQQQLLTEIMMAQDFHDLTGQVLSRVTELARSLEVNLVQLLVSANMAEEAPETAPALSGPVVRPEGRVDVVANQEQVDDLLESLGF